VDGAGGVAVAEKKVRSSFSEEKEAKRLYVWRCGVFRSWLRSWERRKNKSFLVLFFKKERLLFCLPDDTRSSLMQP
jgi:hypothetical protein